MKEKKHFTKTVAFLLVCVIILTAIQLSALAEEVSTSAASRGAIATTQTAYLNNSRSGCYLKNDNGSPTADNGLLSQHGDTIKWTITPISDGSGEYTISTVTNPPLYLSSVSSTVSLTPGGSSIPTNLRWKIQIGSGSGGGCIIQSVNTNRYLYESYGWVSTDATLPSAGTIYYRAFLWRIADSVSYYGSNNTYQYTELPFNYKFKTLYMFSNETRSPNLANKHSKVLWGSAENFTFTGYNSNYVTFNEATGAFTSTSGSGYKISEVTATHKITGYETTFSIVINPEVALLGVNSGDNHDHASCYSTVATRLRNNGYSNVYTYSSTFTTQQIDEYLSEDNYNIFVIRSHADVEMFVEDMQRNTYLQLNETKSTNPIKYRSDASIERLDLSNLRLAMFIGCKTGRGGVGGANLPSVAVECGAETAIGFTESIGCSAANDWTEEFFYYWDSGYTVEMACALLARKPLYQTKHLADYIICGDGLMYID